MRHRWSEVKAYSLSDKLTGKSIAPENPSPMPNECGGSSLAEGVRPYLYATLRKRAYDRNTAFALLAAGKGQSGESWWERCLALLLLENQLLRLAPDNLAEFDP